ncbi:peroxidase family protein [Bosea sp. BH3]|uniref:peroxidase family protein n=1 Tax=Bosea sp. BH3 TaxID=2871701 RepID=UPI0021CB8B4A|nr:peroxidase family protein [Bosea sp. BH3]MCU4179765.1 calcium-binding protein [Bosea sp. BH3]
MFKLNQHDLAFVLKQIKIGEAHANGASLLEIRLDPATGEVVTDPGLYNPDGTFNGPTTWVRAIPDEQTPFGIRTVDGSYNNLVPGREFWGASGQPMPRLLDSNFINEGNDTWNVDFDGPFGPAQAVDLTDNYGAGGNIADRDPRLISNLIVDMSAGNPAALVAALTFAGSEDPQGDLEALLALRITPAQAAQGLLDAQANLGLAQNALQQAIEAYQLAPSDATIDEVQATAAHLTTAETAVDEAQALVDDPGAAFLAKATELGLQFDSRGSLLIPNVAPDEGLSAPFNSWMTFFGQFFDHGLDLITKGGNGTIFMPLNNDDPLVVGADGVFGTGDDLPAQLRFMQLTRSTPVTGPDGVTQENVTTSWVDQNQTYTSHASHQVFLREYRADPLTGEVFATGKLLDGKDADGRPNGLPTWKDIKEQARDVLGIDLTDADVGHVPMLLTDAYGNFIPGDNGFPQIMAAVALDGSPIYVEGNPEAPINPSAIQLLVGTVIMDGTPDGRTIGANDTVSAIRTPNSFLDDIAHNAQQVNSRGQVLTADLDDTIGQPGAGFYDDELLDAHFITGDGRGNENIGLTAVHHIFHSEHNRQVEAQKLTILRSDDLDFINEWLSSDLGAGDLPDNLATMSAAALTEFASELSWDGERLFQAGRFATEMQYQHLVFEEFARKIQPAIDPFVFNSVTDIDPSIFAEFANVVYRFGHSMLTDSMPRVFVDENGNVTGRDDQGLIDAFLNPLAFNSDGTNTISAEEAAGAIVRGMTVERGNEIDEFVTGALRNNLLGIPLDLASINIARGRDTGMPTLNEAREQLYAATSSTFLKPYESWTEFAANLKNPMSVVNFIAAYGNHTSIETATTIADKRAAAMLLVFGGEDEPADRLDFLNATGKWARSYANTPPDVLPAINDDPDPTGSLGGLNDIDLWIGGLAEKKMPFGGFLGSTFNAVFEAQLENLQDGDRFYYLTRTQGLNALNELEQNSFSKMIMANTDIAQPGPDGIRGTPDDIILRHIGIDSFANYDFVFEVDPTKQADYDPDNESISGVDPVGNDAVLEALGLGKVIRDNPNTPGADENYFRTFGGEHVVVGGTNGNDIIVTDFGDDAIWGDAGNDRIEAGAGVDLVNGGAGDDIITDSGDTGDFLKGEEGNDVIANSNGLDILMGGDGQDVVFVGVDDTEVFGGDGDDFILGGDGVDFLLGNEGDDWIEAGGGFDTTAGDNSELFFNSSIIGHDVMFAGSEEHDFDAESGDDIMVQGESVMRNEGMLGFDWAIHKGNAEAADSDLTKPIFTTDAADILRDRFDAVEALSGWEKNDVLRGDDRGATPLDGADGAGLTGAEGTMVGHELDEAGIARIHNLNTIITSNLLQQVEYMADGSGDQKLAFVGGNILLGGAGSDIIEGRGGDDVIDGDAWLNVRISIRVEGADQEITTIDSLKHVFPSAPRNPSDPDDPADPYNQIPDEWHGRSLSELMIDRVIVPMQLNIVREIEVADGAGDVDVAVFNDSFLDANGAPNYTIVQNDDGTFTVTHTNVTIAIDPDTGRQIVSDGVDTVRNVEVLQFTDRAISLAKPKLELNGFDPVTRNWADDFTTRAYANNTGTTSSFTGNWIETGDSGAAQSATAGSIQITTLGTLTFSQNNADNSSIARSLNLANALSATVSFTITDQNITGADNEEIIFEMSGDGVNFTTVATFDNGDGPQTFNVPASALTAGAVLRFRSNNTLDAGETFSIDNVAINAVFLAPSATPSVNITTNYVEDAAPVSIGSDPRITDFGTTLASARIVLTNAFAGDTLVVPAALTANGAPIAATTQLVGSTIVVTLTGTASLAAYQTAIQSIGFRSISQAPDTTPRIIETTVNGGFFESDPAITTITVQSIDDLVDANNDTVITNVLPGTPILVPEWALLANDTDPDNTIDITAVGNASGLVATLGANAITVTDTGALDGSFQYTATGGPATNNATVTLDTIAATTTLSEAFGSTSYTDNDGAWQDNWVETGDDNSSTSDNGQIRINAGRLEFDNGSTVANSNGASILRELSGLAGAGSATISYDVTEALDANETVTVQFSRNGVDIQQIQLINSATGNNGVSNFNLTGPFTADAFIRFTVSSLDDVDDLVSIDNISVTFPSAINGGGNAEILIGDVNGSAFNAGGGNDIIIAGVGNDTIDGGTGNDTIAWNANATGATDGRDFMNGGGNTDTVIVNGNATNEAFVVYSRASAILNGITGLNGATEIVITRNGAVIAELDNIEEIVINTGDGADTVTTSGTFNGTSLNFNTITINGGNGDDTVDVSDLQSAHRIVFRSNGGHDTIVGNLRPQDVVELAAGQDLSTYDLVDNGDGTSTFSNGTHSITFTGAVPPQFGGDSTPDEDTIDGAFELTPRDLEGLKKLVNGERPFDDDDDAAGALGPREVSGQNNNEDNPHSGQADTPFIRLTEARYGEADAAINNRDLNPIYDGLDPRAISNILGAQEAGLPHAGNDANIFFMAFGQYVDHGLDFLPKNAINGSIQIGAPGTGHPGQGNPADLTRGEVYATEDGVPQHLNKTSAYVDQNQAYGSHNLVTQFLRQGDGNGGLTSHLLKGAPDPSNPSFNLLPTLREAIQHHWDNNTIFTDPSLPGGQIAFRTYYSNYPVSEGVTGDLVDATGGFDPQVYSKLANNFMASGQALLLDSNPFISALDHYVAGDGRTNENFALTSMHTIWARNHNFHADQLEAAGFDGTEQELFDAAKILNEAEYQRVVFNEYADTLLGGLRARDGSGGDHGHDGYNPDANAGISHEFAAAAFRFGHSLIGQTLTVMDENGQPKQVSLVDAFLNPTNDASAFAAPLPPGYVPQPGYAQYGVNAILEGVAQQPAEDVDFNIVDAVRNDLVRIQADLFSFNLARGRDVGLGTLNQIRSDLAASNNSYVEEAVGFAGNMSAYESWEDFQQRNDLSDAIIAQFKQAYPDLVLDTPEKLAAFVAANPDIELVNGNTVKGIDRVDFWLGGLAEKHINGGIVGQTFWVVLHEQFDRLQEADRFYYKDRLEAFDFYDDFIDGQEFSDIVARVTGLTDLGEHIFEADQEDGDDNDDDDQDDEDDDDDVGSGGGDDEDEDDDEDDDQSGEDDEDDEDNDDQSGEDDEDDDDQSGEDDEDDDQSGEDDDDDDCGCDDDDDTPTLPVPGAGGLRTGTAQADVLIGSAVADSIIGLAGDDVLIGNGGDDVISAAEGADFVDAGAGKDIVALGAGNDMALGGEGDDGIFGDEGNDRIFGGAGADTLDGGAGDDTVVGGAGDDLLVASAAGDGNDTYYGDDLGGGSGVDTLDMSAITANIAVDLGTGMFGRGNAFSNQTGVDTLWSVENVVTGSGNDTITASNAVNVMEGGAGNDTFRFTSVEAANGDTIQDFEPGDRLDLAAIDADRGAAGEQSFTIVSGGAFTASAQLQVTYETRADGDYTVVRGNVDADLDAEFELDLKGTHTLNSGNTTL